MGPMKAYRYNRGRRQASRPICSKLGGYSSSNSTNQDFEDILVNSGNFVQKGNLLEAVVTNRLKWISPTVRQTGTGYR